MKSKESSYSWRLTNLIWWCLGRTLPSTWYLSLRYRQVHKRWINWEEPVFFTEKLQWLKVYGNAKEYSHLVDKILVKDYVSSKVGSKYVIPTLAVWDSPKTIDISNLDDEFVIKCNHDSGSLIICKDKSKVNLNDVRKKIRQVFHTNYYWTGRETPYKYVKRKIFAEKLIRSQCGRELMDYKFFCFDGEPKIFKVDFGRFVDHHANYYDIDCNLLPFGEVWPPYDHSKVIDIPDNFSEMVEVARKLSEGLPFARIDLYNNDGNILFGEITLFPTSGFGPFTDTNWDKTLGSWISIPPKN